MHPTGLIYFFRSGNSEAVRTVGCMGFFVILITTEPATDSSIAEANFCDKANQLKAIGDLVSSASRELLPDTLGYIGNLIIELSEQAEKDFYVIYECCKHSKENLGGVR